MLETEVRIDLLFDEITDLENKIAELKQRRKDKNIRSRRFDHEFMELDKLLTEKYTLVRILMQ